MTNGDRIRKKIRKMTDKEIAIHLEAFVCHDIKECRAKDISCTKCILEWLRQEAKEDAGTD